MWRNYLIVGLRSLAKTRAYTAINVAGLAVGMAACLLILLFIRYETSYDRWISRADDTYQLQSWILKPKTGQPASYYQMSAYVAGDAMKKDFPQIEKLVYALGSGPAVVRRGEVETAENYLVVNDNFLDVVDLPLARGSRSALAKNDTAVLTQSEAVRQFGTDDVVGRTLTVVQRGNRADIRITGVLKDLPKNSSMKIAAVIRRDFPSLYATTPDFMTNWGWQAGWIYVRLKSGTDVSAIEAGMPAWEKRNIPDDLSTGTKTNQGDDVDWHLVKLADIHLGPAQDGAMTPGNDRSSIVMFAIIAALILGIAVVNFVNLATARASQRAREVALRKVLGATRRQLVVQFLGESVLLTMAAMVLALTFVEIAVRPLSAFLDADLRLNYLGADGLLVPAVGLAALVGIFGGLYPALFLSRFRPAQVLKANRSSAETPGSARLRTLLVVAQFAVSIGLMTCTAVLYAQTVHARAVDPGYARDHILQVENMVRTQIRDKGQAIAEEMRRIPGVVAVGLTGIGVATTDNSTTDVMVPGNPKPVQIGNYDADPGLLDALGLHLIAGRWFDRRVGDDAHVYQPGGVAAQRAIAQRGINIVLNESAVRKLGFGTPQAAIGKVVQNVYFSDEVGLVPLTVVGVVQDSRFRTVRTPVDALMFCGAQTGPNWMVIRYRGDPAAMRAAVQARWKQLANDVPFDAKFSEDVIADLYKAEDARARIFAGFATLAVLIACLGLFGLAVFTAERRTKEIGIRKVLGARTRDVVRLLVWQFSRPVVIANLIAWPIAWWLMRGWLNTYDDRITLGPGPFLIAGLVALGIAILTVSTHAIRIARANPILALRYE